MLCVVKQLKRKRHLNTICRTGYQVWQLQQDIKQVTIDGNPKMNMKRGAGGGYIFLSGNRLISFLGEGLPVFD